MVPESKYIEIQKQPRKTGKKTDIYHVANKANPTFVLAVIKWKTEWHRYIFQPSAAVFDIDCLKDILTFMRHITQEHLTKKENERLDR